MVYIASPYTLGDKLKNVYRQIDVADQLMNDGFCPVVPLLTHYQEERHHKSYEDWMKIDFEKLKRCDALLRLEGQSSGADREVKFAIENRIPVFYDIETLYDAFNKVSDKSLVFYQNGKRMFRLPTEETGAENSSDVIRINPENGDIGIGSIFNKSEKKHGDWELPSENVLNGMYENKDKIGGFTDTTYWSSSEYSSGIAWNQLFSSGYQYGYFKVSYLYVRPVRALNHNHNKTKRVFTVSGVDYQAYKKDLPGVYMWDEALKACKKLNKREK